MRIDSSGRVLIGTTTAGHANADDLTIGSTTANSRGGLTINAANDKDGNIHFGDSDSNLSGIISYTHNNNEFLFYTSATLALTLDSSQNATFAGTALVNNRIQITGPSITDNQANGNNFGIMLSSTGIRPTNGAGTEINGTKDLGHTSYRWKDIYAGGVVYDALGDVRKIPNNATTSAYTLSSSDVGKAVTNTSGGVTVPNGVFAGGSAVTIINHSGSDITITQASGLTLHNAADAATGNRTLAARGMASIWFQAGSVAYISGAGLS